MSAKQRWKKQAKSTETAKKQAENSTEYYNTEYFEKFRTQNLMQRLCLPYIDRKEPLFSYLRKQQAHFSVKTKPKLLDIGCGNGLFLSHAEMIFDCTGIDISQDAINIAAKNTKAQLHCTDFTWLETQKASQYSVLTCFDTLEHVLHHATFFEQAYRLLTDDGILALSMPNADSLGVRLKGRQAFTFRDPSHVWHFSAQDWLYRIRKHGFVPLKSWSGGLIDTPYLPHIPNFLQNVLFKYPTQILSLLGMPLPKMFAETLFVVACKNPGLKHPEFERQVHSR